MKFDLEKFMQFELGPGSSIDSCIKCAAAYAMGHKAEHLYLDLRPLKFYPNGGNWFAENVSEDFALAMDKAEDMLIHNTKSPEVIKKFVMEEATKAGLVIEAAQLCLKNS